MPVARERVLVGAACYHECQPSLRLEIDLALAGDMTTASDLVDDVGLGPWDVRAPCSSSREPVADIRRVTSATTGHRDPSDSRPEPDDSAD